MHTPVCSHESHFCSLCSPSCGIFKKLIPGKMVFLLFILDIALTIEAAVYSDILLIAFCT